MAATTKSSGRFKFTIDLRKAIREVIKMARGTWKITVAWIAFDVVILDFAILIVGVGYLITFGSVPLSYLKSSAAVESGAVIGWTLGLVATVAVGALVIGVLSLVVTSKLDTITMYYGRSVQKEEKAGIGEAFTRGKPRMPRVMLVFLLQYLVVTIPTMLFYVPALVISVIPAVIQLFPQSSEWVPLLYTGLFGTLLLAIGCLMLGMVWSYAFQSFFFILIPYVALGNEGVIQSIKRTWKVFWRRLVDIVATYVTYLIIFSGVSMVVVIVLEMILLPSVAILMVILATFLVSSSVPIRENSVITAAGSLVIIAAGSLLILFIPVFALIGITAWLKALAQTELLFLLEREFEVAASPEGMSNMS
jgi:hypothetical protein